MILRFTLEIIFTKSTTVTHQTPPSHYFAAHPSQSHWSSGLSSSPIDTQPGHHLQIIVNQGEFEVALCGICEGLGSLGRDNRNCHQCEPGGGLFLILDHVVDQICQASCREQKCLDGWLSGSHIGYYIQRKCRHISFCKKECIRTF